MKLPIYASFGIAEVWIEDLQHDRIFIHRDPEGELYRTMFTCNAGESVSIAAFPETLFRVEDFLGA